jgi:hypothetical protein
MKSALIAAPPNAPTIGMACAAAFSEMIIENLDATWDINLTRAGAPCGDNPFLAMYVDASVIALASAALEVK